jgi:hypothetical protein
MHVAIGILSVRDDIHAAAAKKQIEKRQATCHIFIGTELAASGGLSWSSDGDAQSVLLDSEGERVEIRALDAFWYRRTATRQKVPDEADPEYVDDVNLSCWAALHGHLMTEFRGRWVSEPIATELSENKLVQLRAALRAGMRVPATLVSQDPERIRTFCRAHARVIIKPLRARGEVAPTAMASDELLNQDEVLALAPAIYQEYVPGDRHLRVTIFGDRCHAALIESHELDWRLDVTVPFSVYTPSQQLLTALQGTLRSLGLVMGVFDLKLTPEGEIVFFEVNPQGQFLFVEGLCQMPITESLADYLVEQARQAAAMRTL